MNKATYVALILSALVLTGCGGSADDADPETKTFALAGRELRVTTDNAPIDLSAADVESVEVTRWFGGDADEGTWELQGETLVLDSSCGLFGHTCDARYEVIVPRDLAITIESENGALAVSDLADPVTIRGQNGTVTVTECTGPIDIRTDNGDQHVSTSTPDRLTSRTGNGKVDISLDESPSELTATADNGRVNITLPGDAAYNVDISTDNGAVDNQLSTAPDSPHQITVRTDNGRISLNPQDP